MVDEEVREAQSHTQNDEDAPNENHAFHHDPRDVLLQRKVFVDKDFYDENVEGGNGGGLRCGEVAAIDPAENQEGQRNFESRLPGRTPQGIPAKRHFGYLGLVAHMHAIGRQQKDQQDARHDPGDKELIDARAGDEPVEDKRQAWGEEDAQGARGGHQPEAEPLRVGLPDQGRVEEAAKGDDCHPTGAGEGGENGADNERHHSQPTGNPAKTGPGQVDEPGRCAAFGHQVAGKGEKRNGQQCGGRSHPVELDNDRRRVNPDPPEGDEGRRSDDGE